MMFQLCHLRMWLFFLWSLPSFGPVGSLPPVLGIGVRNQSAAAAAALLPEPQKTDTGGQHGVGAGFECTRLTYDSRAGPVLWRYGAPQECPGNNDAELHASGSGQPSVGSLRL